jgi:hypothetical protein
LRQHPESIGKLRTDKVGYMHALTGVVYAKNSANPESPRQVPDAAQVHCRLGSGVVVKEHPDLGSLQFGILDPRPPKEFIN